MIQTINEILNKVKHCRNQIHTKTSILTETIGNKYEGYEKWFGIVKGSENCFYYLPNYEKQILKIDPSNDETTLVREKYIGDENGVTDLHTGVLFTAFYF